MDTGCLQFRIGRDGEGGVMTEHEWQHWHGYPAKISDRVEHVENGWIVAVRNTSHGFDTYVFNTFEEVVAVLKQKAAMCDPEVKK